MGDINNWYADQFHAKLAEWNIHVPPSYTKAELKSLYLASLSSSSNQTGHNSSLGSLNTTPNSKSPPSTNEPPHDKTNKMACAPSEDSDQQMPRLI